MANNHLPSFSQSILFQGAMVLDPVRNSQELEDVWIEDGKIRAIERPGILSPKQAQHTVAAQGYWITPGLIDMHVHLREPGLEYKETIESGTLAAVAGGFTSVACMANTQPVNDNAYVTAFIREKAKAVAACRVFPVGAVTKGLKGEELAEIGGMVAEGIKAISDDGMPVMNSYLMRKAMDYAKAFGIPIISHAEDWNLVGQGMMNEGALSNALGLRGNPAAAEEIMVAREIALCRLTRTPIHLAHISTEIALEHIRRAKDAGLPVTAEASPHHLHLTEECLRTYDTHFKMAPPLRTQKDVDALRAAVAQKLVEVIATDHAPHGLVDKAVEFDQAANGIIGLQTAVPLSLRLVHEGIVTPLRWVDSLSLSPAKILGIPHGTLNIGAAADLTLLDPQLNWVFSALDVQSKSQNSPFLGWKFQGAVAATFVAGHPVYLRPQCFPQGFGGGLHAT